MEQNLIPMPGLDYSQTVLFLTKGTLPPEPASRSIEEGDRATPEPAEPATVISLGALISRINRGLSAPLRLAA